jgi:hypothetical protein
MCFQIDLREQRYIGGADRIAECLFVAAMYAGHRLQTDTPAVPASGERRQPKSTVYLARTGRLGEIEAGGANGNLNRNLMIFGMDG